MKKVIIVLGILLIMIFAGILEIAVTDSIYSELHSSLKTVESLLNDDPKHIDKMETILKVDDTISLWQRHKKYIFTVNNHLIMRNLDEKLVTLKSQIEINADQDAPVTLSALLNFITELKQDNIPSIVNIF